SLVIFLIFFANFGERWRNEWRIALLELCVVLIAVFYFRAQLKQLGRFTLVLVVTCVLLVMSNFLAMYQGVGLADWGRTVRMIVHVPFAAAVFAWFLRDKQALGYVVVTISLATAIYFLLLAFAWVGESDPYNVDWVQNVPMFSNIRH